MEDGLLLHDLCRVCNARPPKYCCPRCHTRTCSLPCCKRHKVWSSCNGKRDPAAKISKQNLATPAAFDHDFNFLNGLERVLDRTGKATQEQRKREGVEGSAFRSSKVQDYATQVGLEIVRAPQGLSRQKSNGTRWVGGKEGEQRGIKWTVEWVLPTGAKQTTQCMEHVPLSKAYAALRKAAPADTEKVSKRKRSVSEYDADGRSKGRLSSNIAPQVQAEGVEPIPEQSLKEENPRSEVETLEGKLASDTATYFFYLVKPLSSTSHTVLIPFDGSSSLHMLLQGKTILEYPTIQVLDEPEHSLPPGFQVESEYRKEHQMLIQEIEEEWRMTTPAVRRPELKSQEDMFNESKVLESLRRDIGQIP